MKRLNELQDVEYERCKSLFLAIQSNLPVPFGFFIHKRDEIDIETIKKEFDGRYLTLHAVSYNREVNRMGTFLKKFEIKEFNNFFWNILKNKADGLLLLSSGFEKDLANSNKLDNILFALKVIKGQILVEGVNGSSKTLYHEGKKDYSFIFDLNNKPSQISESKIYNFIVNYIKEIKEFVNKFGDCIMEFGIINEKPFFFEAKKDTSKNINNELKEIEFISPIINEIEGTAVFPKEINKNKKNIIIAERPDISLNEYLPYASAFIFNEGSLLAHFSIILRENGIPALIMSDNKCFNKKTLKLFPSSPFIRIINSNI